MAVQQLILSSHFGAVPTFHLSPISLDNPQFVSTSLALLTLQCCCVISGSSALEPQTLLSICSDELTELGDTFPRLFENSPLALGQSSAIQSLHTSAVFLLQLLSCCSCNTITLLHFIFNEFEADCETHKPTLGTMHWFSNSHYILDLFSGSPFSHTTISNRIVAKSWAHGTYTAYFIANSSLSMTFKGTEPFFKSTFLLLHFNAETLQLSIPMSCFISHKRGSLYRFPILNDTPRCHSWLLWPHFHRSHRHLSA